MNTPLRHGLSIGIESVNAVGKLTHEDYESITPMIDATEMEGWELMAAWDDFKLGLSHNNDFKKIAIYGHKTWQKNHCQNWLLVCLW